MNFINAFSVGLKEIWANKFRSMLTMLGIILGVSSLVGMAALVKGMEAGAKESLIAIGALDKIWINPADLPVTQRHLRDEAVGITMNDVYALQKSAPLVTKLLPEMRLYGATIALNGKRCRPWNFSGVWPVALEMNQIEIQYGRMFNEIDDETARSVCVIGAEVRDAMFGSPDEVGREINPVGRIIYVNGMPFTIIGMFKHYESEQDRKARLYALAHPQPKSKNTGPARSRGWSGRNDWAFRFKNNTVYIPITTMWVKLRSGGASDHSSWGQNAAPNAPAPPADPRLSDLGVQIADYNEMSAALQQIHNVLMTTHKGIEDFSFRTAEDMLDNINKFIRNARLSGGMIAGISLLVGGIGIMNIMLASISGRIREIGIRKAVGATTVDIFVQILIESVVIAMIGGVAGLAAAYGLVDLISSLSPTENAPIITAQAMIVAFSASVVIGILAGLFPAAKASHYHPIQALRYD